jgi:hypothetical protein
MSAGKIWMLDGLVSTCFSKLTFLKVEVLSFYQVKVIKIGMILGEMANLQKCQLAKVST